MLVYDVSHMYIFYMCYYSHVMYGASVLYCVCVPQPSWIKHPAALAAGLLTPAATPSLALLTLGPHYDD